MIEALTPQLLMLGLLATASVASLLSLLTSAAVLLAYRRGVLRAMAARAAAAPLAAAAWPAAAHAAANLPRGIAAEPGIAYAATRRAARSIVAASAAFALVFACAALLALPALRTLGRLLLLLWVCSWPVVPALLSTAPARRRTRLLWIAAPFLLWAAAAMLLGGAALLAPQTFGRDAVEYFYGITPPQALAGWLLANGPPTLMWWLFSNRRLRAVGPLVLGFASAAAAGGLALLMWLLMTEAGSQWLMGIAGWLSKRAGLPCLRGVAVDSGGWLLAVLALLFLLLLLASAAAGWAFMRAARSAYRAKRANEQSLNLDALWLLFAIWYVMVLVLAGLPWLLTAVLAFGACRLTLRAAQRRQARPAGAAPSLVFLRVFSLGRRSDQLFDRLTRYWRHLASVDLICGPDIVHSTVQPHQLMDFLSGQLAAHFIADPHSLAQRLAERDLAPDHDGRYRVNSFYCHADTWTRVLPALVSGQVVVLMDLRSLSDQHSGCVQELQHLVAAVLLRHCVLVVDGSTDQAFLQSTLTAAWQSMPAASPNCGTTPADIAVHQLAPGEDSLRSLLSRLCAATLA